MTNVESDILELGRRWAEAMVANDADQIGSFMSDDWVIVSERGISTKEHFLSFVRSRQLTHSSFEVVGEPRVRDYGEAVVLSGRIVNTAHFNEHRFDQDEWTTDVFVRQNGRWQCVLSHITPTLKEEI